MSPGAKGVAFLGVLILLVGLALAAALSDKFLGVAVLIVGAFLIVLPMTRPSLDDD